MISMAHRWKVGKSDRGSPRMLGDHLDREVEGQLLDQVGRAPAGEAVDELVDHPLDQVPLPLLEHLGTEGRGHQGPVQPVLGLVHLQDGPTHDRAHDPLVDRRGVRLVVAEHLHRLVETEDGDRLGPGRVDLVGPVPEVDRPDVDRGLAAQLGHPRVGVADVPRDRVLQLERVERDRSQCLVGDLRAVRGMVVQ